jgi:soluble lytic murein transglycosylase-like protein
MIKTIALGALGFAALAQPSLAAEGKKADVKELAARKSEAKQPETKKSEVKKLERTKAPAKGNEAKEAELKELQAQKPEAKMIEPKKEGGALHALIAQHARANGVPEDLVHRVIKRESRYNPRAVGRGGTMGLMQIKHGTARALGYAGTPAGLLSPDTNLTYGVKYLAGAYKVASGDHNRAVAFFARGYYYDAKRKGMLASLASSKAKAKAEVVKEVALAPSVEQTASTTASLFQPVGAPYDGDPR